MSKPTFILGIGAQKSGTSWIHKNLAELPQVRMGFVKEYHVWDALYADLLKSLRVQKSAIENPKNAMRWAMQNIPGFYEDYFQALVGGKVTHTGDMTPSYAILSREHLGLVRQKIKKAGFQIRVLFFIRDPVERNVSVLKMNRRNAEKDETVLDEDEFARIFARLYSSPQMVPRTRYDITIENVFQVFENHEVYVGVYEEMFTLESLKKLGNFLNLDTTEFDVHTKVNAAGTAVIPGELAQECARFYDGVYEYCYRKYPVTTVLWKRWQ